MEVASEKRVYEENLSLGPARWHFSVSGNHVERRGAAVPVMVCA